jgi:uncharacterized Ntn-hydrolase superfamily protein
MTFAVLARCGRTGRIGLAIASEDLCIGAVFAHALRSNTGGSVTLGGSPGRNNTLACNLLAQGYAPARVLQELRANDPQCESRQIAVIDRHGRVAAHTGEALTRSALQRIEPGFAVLAGGAAQPSLVEALVQSFTAGAALELDERLLKALESAAAECAAPPRSAGIVAFGNQDYSDVDLRVDLHDDAIRELRRTYDEYQPFAAYYLERGKHPRQAIPQREFADMLYAGRSGNTR